MENYNIKGLEYTVDEDRYGNIYGFNPPSTREIVETVNQLIEKVNKLETEVEELKAKTNNI